VTRGPKQALVAGHTSTPTGRAGWSKQGRLATTGARGSAGRAAGRGRRAAAARSSDRTRALLNAERDSGAADSGSDASNDGQEDHDGAQGDEEENEEEEDGAISYEDDGGGDDDDDDDEEEEEQEEQDDDNWDSSSRGSADSLQAALPSAPRGVQMGGLVSLALLGGRQSQ
jgi:hypothetical protein